MGKKKIYENAKERKAAQDKRYREKNKEKIRERQKKWYYEQVELYGSYGGSTKEYMEKWREDNQNRIKEYGKEYYQENIETIKEKKKSWRKKAADLISDYNREYQRVNRAKCNGYSAKRRASKRNATPPWLTKEDYECMNVFYEEAKRLTEETGVEHAVDHIHPLCGEYLCGLHVPWNLQVLTKSENSSKRNFILPQHSCALSEHQ